jgi:leucyl-tRNA synthetase
LTAAEKTIRRQLHEAIAKVNRDIGERYKFNTAIAAVMEFMNALGKFHDSTTNARAIRQEAWLAISRMLAPITPHLCHALWSLLGQTDALIDAAFPTPDESAMVRDLITLVVQVNGKLRGQVHVAPDASAADIEALALADAHVARFLEGVTIRKRVLVPGKLLNIVAN